MAGGERNAHIFCLIRHCAGREEGGREGEGGKLFYYVQQELKEKNLKKT